jgi:hypothetical protein
MEELTKEEKILLFKALSTHINFLSSTNQRKEEEVQCRELRYKLTEPSVIGIG